MSFISEQAAWQQVSYVKELIESIDSMFGETETTPDLSRLFVDPSLISSYGASEVGSRAMDEYLQLMKGAPVKKLAQKIGEIVTCLHDADPTRATEKHSWLARFMGRNVESQIRHHIAVNRLDELIADAEDISSNVRVALAALDALLVAQSDYASKLAADINAGYAYLERNPSAGKPATGALEFDNPRERFSRKLSNLDALLTSHEMSAAQMTLSRGHVIGMLDRFDEAVNVLVPIWRQHALSLLTSKNMNPTMLSEARKVHQNLMRSLAQSMN